MGELAGTPCVNPKCETGVLGKLKCSKKNKSQDVSLGTVWYRCDSCTKKHSVVLGNPLFKCLGHGCKAANFVVVCFWNCVQGATLTYTCKQLMLRKKFVGWCYGLARKIMAWDARQRQEEFQFGHLPEGQTCDVEADEASFFSWHEDGPFAESGRRYWYYVWLGICQRGTNKFWLKCMGLRCSHEEGRLPNSTRDAWHEVWQSAVGQEANVVLMTDSCPALTGKPWSSVAGCRNDQISFVLQYIWKYKQHMWK